MIHWAWLIAAFLIGKLVGIVSMAIIVGSTDKAEEKAKKRAERGG